MVFNHSGRITNTLANGEQLTNFGIPLVSIVAIRIKALKKNNEIQSTIVLGCIARDKPTEGELIAIYGSIIYNVNIPTSCVCLAVDVNVVNFDSIAETHVMAFNNFGNFEGNSL